MMMASHELVNYSIPAKLVNLPNVMVAHKDCRSTIDIESSRAGGSTVPGAAAAGVD